MKNYNDFEMWVSVNGLDGLYEISDQGRVRRVKVDKKGKISYKYLKPENRDGRIDFYKDGVKVKRGCISKLVYEHFGIPTEKGEIWKDTENKNVKISSLGRVYNIETGHFLDGVNVKVTRMTINAFGLPTEDDETWKDIEGFEGLYQVSDQGRVRNVMTGRILKQYKNNRGYFRLSLCKEGEYSSYLVHRLVAEAFIFNPNPKEYDQVNHKDEDPNNNRADNLEWCSSEYNLTYGTRAARISDTYAMKRQEKLDNCETKEEKDEALKAMRLAENSRRWYWKQKNQ